MWFPGWDPKTEEKGGIRKKTMGMNKVNTLFFCKYKNHLKTIKLIFKRDLSITLLFYLYLAIKDV